jgi:membrane-associated protease RseP (regulator of RpoE activity)
MRPWQRWFWRRDAPLLLWLVIALFLGWLLLGPSRGGPRWWWPFEGPVSGQGADLTPDIAQRLVLPPAAHGVVVQGARPGGLGQRLGLRPGDVIQEVSGRPVGSCQEFAQAVAEAADRDVVLLVHRRGQVAYVVLEHRSPG